VEYGWKLATEWAALRGNPRGDGVTPAEDSVEAFITEHYWGYTRQRNATTVEYRVDHPRWRVWPLDTPQVSGDLTTLYGSAFAKIVRDTPASAFLADGSRVTVFAPTGL
jgi:hypothetical protein